MDTTQPYNALPAWLARRTHSAQLFSTVGAQAAFHPLTARHLAALYEAPVPCTAVTMTCFRADGALLTWRSRRDLVWDVPYYALPPGADAARYAMHLLTDLGGVTPAQLLQVFGLVDWGPAARCRMGMDSMPVRARWCDHAPTPAVGSKRTRFLAGGADTGHRSAGSLATCARRDASGGH